MYRSMRELPLQVCDALLKGLAIDGGIGNLRIPCQCRQEFALIAVEVGSDHMAAVERDGEATARIADRNAENRSRQIARKTRVRWIDAAEAGNYGRLFQSHSLTGFLLFAQLTKGIICGVRAIM